MNNTILIGRLTRDPETRVSSTGNTITTFSIAIDRPGRDAGADFIKITTFGDLAENCGRYLSKGRQVAVRGHLRSGKYEEHETGKTRYTLDVIADNVEFLAGGQGHTQENARAYDGGRGTYDRRPVRPVTDPVKPAPDPQQADNNAGRQTTWEDYYSETDEDIPF